MVRTGFRSAHKKPSRDMALRIGFHVFSARSIGHDRMPLLKDTNPASLMRALQLANYKTK